MGKHVVDKIDDKVKIQTMLVSVSDKAGLETFIPGMLDANPDLVILSTGGTYTRLKEILGERAETSLKPASSPSNLAGRSGSKSRTPRSCRCGEVSFVTATGCGAKSCSSTRFAN